MSEQDKDCSARFDPSLGIPFCTSNDGLAMAEGGTTASGGLATIESLSTTNVREVMAESSLWARHVPRPRFTLLQLEEMQKEYLRCKYPKFRRRAEIASAIQKTQNQVNNWFKRRRKDEGKDAKQRTTNKPFLVWLSSNVAQSTTSPNSSMNVNQRAQEMTPCLKQSHFGSMQTFQSVEMLRTDRSFSNRSRDPVPEQEVEALVRDQPFDQNCYSPFFTANIVPSCDPAPGQEVEVKVEDHEETPYGRIRQRGTRTLPAHDHSGTNRHTLGSTPLKVDGSLYLAEEIDYMKCF